MPDSVRQFSRMGGIVGKSSVAAERLGDVFSEESEIREPSSPVVPNSCRGELEFRSVSFNYGAGDMVLRSISFRADQSDSLARFSAQLGTATPRNQRAQPPNDQTPPACRSCRRPREPARLPGS